MADERKPSLDWTLERQEPGPDLMLFTARYDWLRNPRNGVTLRRLVLESVDWVNVVAVTSAGETLMVEQYRFGIGATTWEPPGGLVDTGESSLQSARRELLEETGFGGGRWSYLGSVEPNPAIHDHRCHHWLAQDVVPSAAPTPGEGEALAVHRCSVDELRAAVVDGRLRHALALSALSRVYQLWPLPNVTSPASP